MAAFVDIEAADSDIAHTGLGRHKALPAHVDFYVFLVGVLSLEIGINHGFVLFGILLGVPFVDGFLRNPATLVHFAFRCILPDVAGLVERPIV